jgi:hypothetical protein
MRDSPGISKNAALALAECGVTSDTRIDCAARASPFCWRVGPTP